MSPPARRPIRRLTPETASRIAAGEVIERPLSALKEVLENALDAGATRIEIAVDGSLDRGFTVADDGSGIAASELDLALERHATSKIDSLDDLDRLASLGFRGEALPSIAAVSRLRITSRAEGEEAAATLVAEGGEILERGTAARARGTTVEVRDLFFNTPARRKFLRSPAGELRAALRMIEAQSLAYPEVAFRVTVDGRERLSFAAAATPRERAASLWGAGHAEQRIEIEGERDGMRLYGLLGLPEHARATRDGQTFLVNRRWIQSPSLAQALRQAYGNLIPDGRFPSAALWITVPAERLDVNVHPTKREVRFASEDSVFALVAGASAQKLAPLHPPFTVVAGGSSEPRWAERVSEPPPDQTYLGLDETRSPASRPPEAPAETTAAAAARAGDEGPVFWQLHNTYIFAPVRDGLVIVDQHAAHERVLYEEARARLEGQRGASQQLLFPLLVDLPRDRFDLILEVGPQLQQLGWDLAPLGPPTVVIRGVPAGFADHKPGSLLQDMLDGVAEDSGRAAHEDVTEKVARSYACHAAVRAGDPLTQEEMKILLDRLFGTTRPHGDPHGRPTFVRMGLDDLHRRFGRT